MATSDSYGQGLSLAALTDAPNIETLLKGFVDALASRSIMRFASASARAATLVGAAAPVEGMMCWLLDVNVLQYFDGTSWLSFESPQVQTFNGNASLAAGGTTNYFALNLGGQVSGNTSGMWASGNPTRLVVPTAGTYEMNGVIIWQGSLGATDGRAEFRLNGSGTGSLTARFNTIRGSAGNSASVASGTLVFTAPGYVEVFANQNTGATISLSIAVGLKRISTAIA